MLIVVAARHKNEAAIYVQKRSADATTQTNADTDRETTYTDTSAVSSATRCPALLCASFLVTRKNNHGLFVQLALFAAPYDVVSYAPAATPLTATYSARQG